MILEVTPKKVFKIHIVLIFLLLLGNIISIVKLLNFADAITAFDFDAEKNIPTHFSSLMLIISSGLLFLIAVNNKKTKSPYIAWLGLSLIFLFLSLDEAVSIHEKLNTPLRETFNASGLLYYAWVIPYGLGLILFVATYTKFLLNLSKKIRFLFLISGFIFVLGAIGFELLGGNQAEAFGVNNILYTIYFTCEEFLEMLGIAVFIYTLLTYIENQWGAFTINSHTE